MNTMFESMSSSKMADLIRQAKEHVTVASPAIHDGPASALVEVCGKGKTVDAEVIIDCDEEVMRLGYGDIKAIKKLKDAEIPIRQSTGLRIGVLIVDNTGWIFTPTALYVQAEVHSDETPNAVRLSRQEAEQLVMRLSVRANQERITHIETLSLPETLSPLENQGPPETLSPPENQGLPENKSIEVPSLELGPSEVSEEQLSSVSENLEVVPPVPFDVTRQVRVFHPYIQYVDISLHGCAIERMKISLPKSILAMGGEPEIQQRLRTTFDLIERGSEVSSKELNDRLGKIREAYTKSLGQPWGRVLLRAKRKKFDEVIKEFHQQVLSHEEQVRDKLENYLMKSFNQVVDYYQPIVKSNPPEMLQGQITTEKPTDEQAKLWLQNELQSVFPSADRLIRDMSLEVHFRDVTYETLKEKDFGEKLRNAFEYVDWDKPFDAFNAAKEKSVKDKNQ